MQVARIRNSRLFVVGKSVIVGDDFSVFVQLHRTFVDNMVACVATMTNDTLFRDPSGSVGVVKRD